MTHSKWQKVEEQGDASDRKNYINRLPDELLLKVLEQLGRIPPDGGELQSPAARFPFRTIEGPNEPHPGLRSYPFLGQVCKHWNRVLDKPESRNAIWHEVVVDFGHELITAVHTPIAWSDKRPSDEEFKQSFSRTKLDADKILSFVEARKASLKRIVLMSSEGYISEEGDFVNLVSKHDFTMVSFGMLCGLLYASLEELTVMRCSDFFNVNSGAFGTIACLKALKSLHLEDLHCRLDQSGAAKLSKLTQLTELSLTQEQHSSNWLIGLEKIPQAWSTLVNLQCLTLRGHGQLTNLPPFIANLPLKHLDISCCKMLSFELLPSLTNIETLCLQGMGLTEKAPFNLAEPDLVPSRLLPDLSPLKKLKSLNLSDNKLDSIPAVLSKLTDLRFLDLSANERLQVMKPLTQLQQLSRLVLVDLRMIHMECDLTYWSEAKCGTMGHISNWQKAIRRRGGRMKVLLDTDN